jgi:hypothetical protein
MTTKGSGIRRTAAAAAGLAITLGCVPLAFADTGGEQDQQKHLAVDCPQPYSQKCPPRDGISFDTSNDSSKRISFYFQADPNPPACAPGLVTVYLDGAPKVRASRVEPGQNTEDYNIDVTQGPHRVEAEMAGTLGGCNTGAMSGWSGTLYLATNQPTGSRPPPPGGPGGPPPVPPGGPTGPTSVPTPSSQPGGGFIPPK